MDRQEKIERIIKLRDYGLTSEEIAERLHISRSNVTYHIANLLREGVIERKAPPEWSDEASFRLIKLKKRGLTHGQIAIKMGRTRNAVSGRVSRLKYEGLL